MMPKAARERGYEPRPREPHSLHQSAVTGDALRRARFDSSACNGNGDECQAGVAISVTPVARMERSEIRGCVTAGKAVPGLRYAPSGLRSLSPLRQPPDLRACCLFRDANLIGALQIEPELCAGAEPMAETQRRIAGDRPLAVEDLRDAVCRH